MAVNASRGFTLATKITVMRLLMVPVFAVCMVYRRPGLGFIVFGLACLGDALDGYIARSREEYSSLGATLDPMADKLLMFSAYVLMGINGQIPAWLAILIICRDVLISAGYLSYYLTHGFITPEPSRLGKYTTAAQMITIVFALLVWTMDAGASLAMSALYYLTGALTAISGVHYSFFVGARMLAGNSGRDQTGGRPPVAES
jgi:cardiolipin synthase